MTEMHLMTEPSWHTAPRQRRINASAMPLRGIDVDATLHKRHVAVGRPWNQNCPSMPWLQSCKRMIYIHNMYLWLTAICFGTRMTGDSCEYQYNVLLVEAFWNCVHYFLWNCWHYEVTVHGVGRGVGGDAIWEGGPVLWLCFAHQVYQAAS